jgi:hypothetical protein
MDTRRTTHDARHWEEEKGKKGFEGEKRRKGEREMKRLREDESGTKRQDDKDKK